MHIQPSSRAWSHTEITIIVIATILAALAIPHRIGTGIAFESSGLLDEEFVLYNAFSLAHSWPDISIEKQWWGYCHYSPLFPFLLAGILKAAATVVNLPPETWRVHIDFFVMVGRTFGVAIFALGLFFFRECLHLVCAKRRSSALALACYVSIVGPLHVASVIRVEGVILTSFIILIWTILVTPPVPRLKGWLLISSMAALTIGFEVYAMIPVAFILFCRATDALFSMYKESNSFKMVLINSIVILLVAVWTLLLAATLNIRIWLQPEAYVYNSRAMAEFTILRRWQTELMFNYGPTRTLFWMLIPLLEAHCLIVFWSLCMVIVGKARPLAELRWLFPGCFLLCMCYGYLYASRTVGPYLLFPLFPVMFIIVARICDHSGRCFQMAVIVAVCFGLLRVSILQIARGADHSNRQAVQYVLEHRDQGKALTIFDLGLMSSRYLVSQRTLENFPNSNPAWQQALPPQRIADTVTPLPPLWSIDDANPLYPKLTESESLSLIQTVLKRDLDTYDIVIIDDSFSWYDKYWSRKRSPELTGVWVELRNRLTHGRPLLFVTGAVDGRNFLQSSPLNPLYSLKIAGELLEWWTRPAPRGSPFGPKITVYGNASN